MRDLTEQQAAFVAAFTSEPGAIGNASEAARRAGYSEKSAREIGRQLLDKPHVRGAIDDANRAQISGVLATKATETLEGILNDPDAPAKLKLDAAKTVLDRAGIIAPRAEERPTDHDGRGLEGLTAEELRAFIACAEAEVADEAAEGDAEDGADAGGANKDRADAA